MVLAVTMGEPAGIGGELTLKAWLKRKELNVPVFCAVDNPSRLASVARALGYAIPIREIRDAPQTLTYFDDALPVMPIDLAKIPDPGQPAKECAAAVINSIDVATNFALSKHVQGIVTQPINKSVLYETGFQFPGHTEYLQHITKSVYPSIMMLVGGGLRVVPLTIHESLISAITSLTRELIEETAIRVVTALRHDFGIAEPRLAIAGLNPHAGEGGALGNDEVKFIRPAVENLRAMGHNVTGPHAPDSMFHTAARSKYDVALCMYHDQALIPLKTLAFDEGVNVTLGLPIVRTSPDHGTAFDIAGKGIANPSSFIAALQIAEMIANFRAE